MISPVRAALPVTSTDLMAGMVAVKFRKADGTDVIVSLVNTPGTVQVEEGDEGEFYQGTIDVGEEESDADDRNLDDRIRLSFIRSFSDDDPTQIVEDGGNGEAIIHLGSLDVAGDVGLVEDVRLITFTIADDPIVGEIEVEDGGDGEVIVHIPCLPSGGGGTLVAGNVDDEFVWLDTTDCAE